VELTAPPTPPKAPPPTGPFRQFRRSAVRRPRPAATPPRSRPPLPLSFLVPIWTMASISVLTVWFLAYAFGLSGLQEARSQHELYAALRSELAQEVAPPFQDVASGKPPTDDFPLGLPLAVLRVPQAGISDVVLAGTTSGVLEQGPGLWRDTPLPGQPGVSVIWGRHNMFGGPFRHLAALRRGDLIHVTTGQGTFTYAVTDLRYPGDPLPPPLAAGQSRLILATAVGPGWRGAWAPNTLLYVDATMRGKTVGYPGGLPAEVLASENPMQGDTSVLLPLILWLQLLLFTVVAVVWAGTRWGRWQTWLVGIPAILAVLWVVSDTVFQVLPNLL
jgi:sortase A